MLPTFGDGIACLNQEPQWLCVGSQNSKRLRKLQCSREERRIVRFEELARWNTRALGKFIADAEETGPIAQIGACVFEVRMQAGCCIAANDRPGDPSCREHLDSPAALR